MGNVDVSPNLTLNVICYNNAMNTGYILYITQKDDDVRVLLLCIFYNESSNINFMGTEEDMYESTVP